MKTDIDKMIPLGVGCRWRSILKPGYRKPRIPSVTKRIVIDGLRCQELKRMKTAMDIRAEEARRAEQAKKEGS